MKTRLLLAIALLSIVVVGFYFWSSKNDTKNDPSGQSEKQASQGPGGTGTPGALEDALATLSGQVQTEDGQGLADASIQLVPQEKQSQRLSTHDAVTRSQSDGQWTLKDLPPGEYVLSASAPGFLPSQIEIEARAGEAEGKIVLTLKAGGQSLSGAISDLTGGTVAAAIVHVFPLSVTGLDRRRSASAQSDDAGHYQLNLGAGRYLVQALHTDYVPKSQVVEIGAGAQTLDFGLSPGAVVEGVVHHLGTGEIVPGARVSYSTKRVSRFNIFSDSVGGGSVRADAQGHFRISGLHSGSLELSARGDNAATSEPTLVALGIAEQVTDVHLYLASAFRIAGRVIDAANKEPIAGIAVSANREGVGVPALGLSDAEGRFEISGLPAGKYRLQGEGKPYLRELFGSSIELNDDVGDALIELSKGAMVIGRVEPAGVAEIRVDLSAIKGFDSNAFMSALSEEDGTFEFGPVHPASFRLQAKSTQGQLGSADVVVPSEGLTDVVISMKDGSSISGTVVDATGTAQSDVKVSLRPDTGGRSVSIVVNGQDMMASSAHTSPDGSFKITGLKEGAYKMSVLDNQGEALQWANSEAGNAKAATRYVPKTVSLSAQQESSDHRLQVVNRDAKIVGTVIGPDGKAAPDVWVTASSSRAEAMAMPPMPRPAGGPRPEGGPGEEGTRSESVSTVVMVTSDEDEGDHGGPGLDLGRGGELPPVLTDAKGEFTISGLREGKYDLVAEGMRGSARGFTDAAQTGEDATIQLLELTRIEGKVTIGDKVATNFSVELSGLSRRHKRVRNAEGKFTMHRVDPGHYTVNVRSDEGEAEAEIDVKTGETTTVELNMEVLTRVRGSLVDEEGLAIAGAIVTSVPRQEDGRMNLMIGDEAELTGADGSFEFGVKSGKYLIIALKPGAGPLARKTLDVAEGEVTIDVGVITGKAGGGFGPGPGGPGEPGEDVEEETP